MAPDEQDQPRFAGLGRARGHRLVRMLGTVRKPRTL